MEKKNKTNERKRGRKKQPKKKKNEEKGKHTFKNRDKSKNIQGVYIYLKASSTQKRYTKLCLETEPYSFV